MACPPPALDSLAQLQGLRLNIGTGGSGVPQLMEKLSEANTIDLVRRELEAGGA